LKPISSPAVDLIVPAASSTSMSIGFGAAFFLLLRASMETTPLLPSVRCSASRACGAAAAGRGGSAS
jgi:hypothetical protein